MAALADSLYLDMTSFRMRGYTEDTDVAEAYGIASKHVKAVDTVNVAITLPRANDPTALLTSDWATRQTTLANLEASGTLWPTYGADQAQYAAAVSLLTGNDTGQFGLTMLGDRQGSDGYISSAESRTIWLQLTPDDFLALFGTQPYQATEGEHGPVIPLIDPDSRYFWNGSLSLPDTLSSLGVGIWFDFLQRGPGPAYGDPTQEGIDLQPGPQSIGNSLSDSEPKNSLYPSDMAKWFYNFPLARHPEISTPTIGLLEPGSADALPADSQTFQELLDTYRSTVLTVATPGHYYTVANNGRLYSDSDASQTDPGERSLDVGVIAGASPGSTIGLYAGSGFAVSPPQGTNYTGAPGTTEGAYSNVFTAFQAAFWDQAHNPPIISASTSMGQQTKPGSPFAIAAAELFVDAALRNITVLKADNDIGSSWGFNNGLANQNVNASSPYVIVVGGTSITTHETAPKDPTTSAMYAAAMAGDPSVLWPLVVAGLKAIPGGLELPQSYTFLEAVWNQYTFTPSDTGVANAGTWSGDFGAGDGGVDTTQPTPWYQRAFGLLPMSANPAPYGGSGRGAPDVAANAGANMWYYTPPDNMEKDGYGPANGTSAAAPLWAALMAQVERIFDDQGLPRLGFATDLLYAAAAVAPASFNDITMGNNVSSYYFDSSSPVLNGNGDPVVLTGFGYQATAGYDLTTGLGTPNGVLLARALSWIAHSQMYYADEPQVVDGDLASGWTSGATQSLLFQTMSPNGVAVDVSIGGDGFDYTSAASGAFAWTSRLAMQSLQPDFDSNLVRLFDGYAQGTQTQYSLNASDSLTVSIGGQTGQAIQAGLTSAYGFADFMGNDGVVRVARPVAVAETAGATDDQLAIVRLRQNGQDTLGVTFYKVDDLSGTINGIAPGQQGYEAAAQANAYLLATGGTLMTGPGYGNFAQNALTHVDAGDLVAMKLSNLTQGDTYYAFSQANLDGQGHLWNYGLNTWGWEDTRGGGDQDFNDVIVQLDFTSASGHGWLV
jgi:hypothetical protein